MRAKEIIRLEDARIELGKGILISVDGATKSLVGELETTLKPYTAGDCRVHIRYKTNNAEAQFKLGEQWNVVPQRDLMRRLVALNGVKEARVVY